MNNQIVSAIARSKEGQNLVDFAKTYNIHPDWSELPDAGVQAMLSGCKLDNRVGNFKEDEFGGVNKEYVISLFGPDSGGEHMIAINLANLLAMATAYAHSELEKAAAKR